MTANRDPQLPVSHLPLIRLQVLPGSLLSWFGPAWATLAGALASGRLSPDGPSLIFLLLAVFLTDALMGGLWTAIASTDWGAPWRPLPDGERGKAMAVSLPSLPHTAHGSPAHRLGEWLAGGLGHWRAVAWPQLSLPFLRVGFFAVIALAVATVMGIEVALLIVAGLALAMLRAIWAHYWRGDYRSLAALYHFGLAWLVGYAALGGLQSGVARADGVALLLAAAYTLTYYGYLGLSSSKWGLLALDGGQILAVVLLIAAYRPWQAGLVGLLLVAQALWQPKLWRDGDGEAYLRGTLAFLLAGVLVVFL